MKLSTNTLTHCTGSRFRITDQLDGIMIGLGCDDVSFGLIPRDGNLPKLQIAVDRRSLWSYTFFSPVVGGMLVIKCGVGQKIEVANQCVLFVDEVSHLNVRLKIRPLSAIPHRMPLRNVQCGPFQDSITQSRSN